MARRRIALSMSSWFVVPEFDMKDLEILSRASAFLVRAQSSQVLLSFPFFFLFSLKELSPIVPIQVSRGDFLACGGALEVAQVPHQ